jgi:chromosome segregation ATPase
MEKIREDEAHEASTHHAPTAKLAPRRAVAHSEDAAVQQLLDDTEIELRAISHDFTRMFVEAEAQSHLLVASEERCEQLQEALSRAETHMGELEDDVLGAKSTVESLRAENLSLRRRIEELTELKDAASIPKVRLPRR